MRLKNKMSYTSPIHKSLVTMNDICKQTHEATVKISSEFLNVDNFLTFAYQFILTHTGKLITELKINDI